jgi:hypothetical protein
MKFEKKTLSGLADQRFLSRTNDNIIDNFDINKNIDKKNINNYVNNIIIKKNLNNLKISINMFVIFILIVSHLNISTI